MRDFYMTTGRYDMVAICEAPNDTALAKALLSTLGAGSVQTETMRAFTEERDWGRYHDPKSLVLALVGEVGELAEIFQWLPAEQAMELARAQPLRKRVAEELADVLVYLVRLADVLDVDLGEATRAKLHAARGRYPVGDVPGQAPIKR